MVEGPPLHYLEAKASGFVPLSITLLIFSEALTEILRLNNLRTFNGFKEKRFETLLKPLMLTGVKF
jgi:hypothetical protein